VKLQHVWSRATPMFDDENLVSCTGLVPVMALGEQTGLSELVGDRVAIKTTRVASAAVNPAGKLTSIVAGMAAGADSIDDLEVIRAGGMPRLFDQVYASATLGQFLREFTHGHTLQLASVLRAHLVSLAGRTDLLPGIAEQAFVDIDSLLRPVYGHAKQGASFGHAKVSGRQVLRRGLSPLATTISTASAAPVIAGVRLRAGKAGSGRGAGSMVTEAVATARAAGATDEILVRGDSAYGTRSVVGACVKAKVRFSVVLAKNPAVNRAIGAIAEDAWRPVHYPGSVVDPDTGELICDAEVAETTYTAFASTSHPVTARLVVRRVRDRNKLAEAVSSDPRYRSRACPEPATWPLRHRHRRASPPPAAGGLRRTRARHLTGASGAQTCRPIDQRNRAGTPVFRTYAAATTSSQSTPRRCWLATAFDELRSAI